MNEDRVKPDELFMQHFTRYHKRIRAYVYALVHDRHRADDVFQSTSLVLWRKFDQFDREGDFMAWACGVAYFEVRGYLRSASRDRLRFNEGLLQTLADERAKRHERSSKRSAMLQQCLRKLNAKDRQLIEQSYSGKQTIKELAEQMGRAVQTLYNRLSRIRHQLLECVEKNFAEQEV